MCFNTIAVRGECSRHSRAEQQLLRTPTLAAPRGDMHPYIPYPHPIRAHRCGRHLLCCPGRGPSWAARESWSNDLFGAISCRVRSSCSPRRAHGSTALFHLSSRRTRVTCRLLRQQLVRTNTRDIYCSVRPPSPWSARFVQQARSRFADIVCPPFISW